MSDLSSVRSMIQVEETDYKSAASEAFVKKLGKSVNFINTNQYDTKDFFLNGRYNIATMPQTAVDGLYIFPYDVEIFNAYAFNIVAGSSGTTELDIKRLTASGGTGTSIFSTTPKIAYTAGDNAYVGAGETGTGLTAPILSSSPFNISAGDAIYCDIIQAQGGNPENCGILVYFRPR